jgi:hypothetical protein
MVSFARELPVIPLGTKGANSGIPTRRVYKEFNFETPNEIAGLFLILYNYPPNLLKLDRRFSFTFPHTSSAFTADLTQ